MTLTTGTALHHGNYVVDAFSAEDAIGPIYLATHIPSGRWVQLRILGSRHPEAIPYPEVRKAFYNYLLTVQALNHPLFSAHLSGFEDEGVCYQAMDANLGHPLVRVVTPGKTLTPSQSLSLVRQVGQGLMALKHLGWQGITLTPDQLWQRPNLPGLTFTGFDLPSPSLMPDQQQEALVVRGLSYLLYFLLTGKRAENTQAPLAVDVRNQLPGLPYDLDTALQLGSRQAVKQPSLGLKQWLDLLPSTETLPAEPAVKTGDKKTVVVAPGPLPSQHQTRVVREKTDKTAVVNQKSMPLPAAMQSEATRATAVARPNGGTKTRKFASMALGLTALVASVGGLGAGLTTRLHPAATPGSPVKFNPEQSFPPLSDWSGDDPVNSWDYSPSRRDLPDYSNVAPRQALDVPDTPAQSSPDPAGTSELIPVTDPSGEESLGLEAPLEDDNSFFEDPEPFTSGADSNPSAQPPGAAPELEGLPSDADGNFEPVVPVRPAGEPFPASVPVAPQPLAPPAPLQSPPPSAPTPSTS